MKGLLSRFKFELITLMAKQISFVSKSGYQELNSETMTLSSFREHEKDKQFAIMLLPDCYIKFEKNYRVISKKELEKIIENEKCFLSPFENSYSLYRIFEKEEGVWDVLFYFIDLNAYSKVNNFKVVLVWDDFLRHSVAERTGLPLLLDTEVGIFFIEASGPNRFGISLFSKSSQLKNQVLSQSYANDIKTEVLKSDKVFQYLLSLEWISLNGCFNKGAYSRPKLIINPRRILYACLLILSIAAAESLYLKVMSKTLEISRSETADLRDEFSSQKLTFFNNLERYNNYFELYKNKTDVASLPLILSNIPNADDLSITRLDYLQGEVRINGTIADVEPMMAFLSEQPNIRGLDFISPITPDRQGRDKFSIRFDYFHGK